MADFDPNAQRLIDWQTALEVGLGTSAQLLQLLVLKGLITKQEALDTLNAAGAEADALLGSDQLRKDLCRAALISALKRIINL